MSHEPRVLGRPRKSEGPRVPYEEVDRILVFGEVIKNPDGEGTIVYFPTYRELADRYNVSHSVIAEYAKTRNIQRRRKETHARVQAKVEQKLIEHRANAIALTKDDELRIIDSYLMGFEKALSEERVRFDNPADFNTMVRLKEFVLGNADSRQEIHATLSLESLQSKHKHMMRTVDATPAECGEIERRSLASSVPAGGESGLSATETATASQEPSGRFGEGEKSTFVVGPVVGKTVQHGEVVGADSASTSTPVTSAGVGATGGDESSCGEGVGGHDEADDGPADTLRPTAGDESPDGR